MGRSERNNSIKLEGIFSNGYGIIPKSIMRDTEISAEAKAIYAYLSSFAGSGNTAFPSVSLMCHELGMGENRFYKHRKQLVDKDYISIEKVQEQNGTWQNNVYTLINKPYRQNEGGRQNAGMENEYMDIEGMENEGTNNNSSINNNLTNNNLTNKDHSTAKAERIPYKEIIDYLNQETGRNYSHSANKNKDLIKARWNEGFRVDEFKKVIDKKVADAKNPNHFFSEAYLRPQTLFSNKFDGYLNQPINNWKGGNNDEYEQYINME